VFNTAAQEKSEEIKENTKETNQKEKKFQQTSK
jgi:hypothetical protein